MSALHSLPRLIEIAAEFSNFDPSYIKGTSREKWAVKVRYAVAYVARQKGFSLPRIGKALGGRDHSTIMAGLDKCVYLMERDKEFIGFVGKIGAQWDMESSIPLANISQERKAKMTNMERIAALELENGRLRAVIGDLNRTIVKYVDRLERSEYREEPWGDGNHYEQMRRGSENLLRAINFARSGRIMGAVA